MTVVVDHRYKTCVLCVAGVWRVNELCFYYRCYFLLTYTIYELRGFINFVVMKNYFRETYGEKNIVEFVKALKYTH